MPDADAQIAATTTPPSSALWRTLSARVTPEENAAFEALARELGLTRNKALRRLLRRAAGFLEPDEAAIGAWRDMARQLRGVAVNVNQLARNANAGKILWTERDRELMRETGRQSATLARALATFADGAARRAEAARAAKIILREAGDE